MAKAKIVIHEDGLVDLLNRGGIKTSMLATASEVAAVAQTTASSAEEGAGGRIDGYAAAGFSVQWEARSGKRPRANIVSNAPIKTFLAAHFHTQKRDGVAHLRAALYKLTRRG